MKKIVIAIMLLLGLIGCVPAWGQACDSTYEKLQLIKAVMSEQSRMIKESPALWEQNLRLDRIAEMSIVQDELMNRYIQECIKK